jgi:hypothetical protein
MFIRPSTARKLQLGEIIAAMEREEAELRVEQDLSLGSRDRAEKKLQEHRDRLLKSARDLDWRVIQQLRFRPAWWSQLVLLVALGVVFVFAAVHLVVQENPSSWSYPFAAGPPPVMIFVLNRLRGLEAERLTLSLRVARYVPRIEAALSLNELRAIAREIEDDLRFLTDSPRQTAPEPKPHA